MIQIAVDNARADFRVIGAVGLAHFSSHFFQLVLPPLLPMMTAELGFGYVELGALMTVFFAVSGVFQVLAGFLVDRIGARHVLPAGVAVLAGGIGLVGFAGNLWTMLALTAIAGVGNAIFHPADYSLLSGKVSMKRMARGYSVHAITGTLGWAAAPIAVIALAQAFGWRAALLSLGAAGLVLALGLSLAREELSAPEAPAIAHPVPAKTGVTRPLLDLLSASVLFAFVYFFLLQLSLGAAQAYLPSLLPMVQGVSLAFATLLTSIYLTGAAFGAFAGGFLADRTRHYERIIGVGLTAAACLLLTLGFVAAPAWLLAPLAVVAGFCVGMTGPSRDMLVRQAAPPGATGKVFGFVYSGLDLASLSVPTIVGAMIDAGAWRTPFAFMAGALAATVVAALAVKKATGAIRPA